MKERKNRRKRRSHDENEEGQERIQRKKGKYMSVHLEGSIPGEHSIYPCRISDKVKNMGLSFPSLLFQGLFNVSF